MHQHLSDKIPSLHARLDARLDDQDEFRFPSVHIVTGTMDDCWPGWSRFSLQTFYFENFKARIFRLKILR